MVFSQALTIRSLTRFRDGPLKGIDVAKEVFVLFDGQFFFSQIITADRWSPQFFLSTLAKISKR